MSQSLILLLIVGVLTGMVWFWPRQHKPKRAGKVPHSSSVDGANTLATLQKLQANSLFWGVSISRPGCVASRQLMNRQFTFGDAPVLPLPDCDAEKCTCQYSGLKHRRGGGSRRVNEDRRNEVRFDKERPERRSHKTRRRGEKWEDHSH
jgi:hypothetical protein